MLQALPIRNSVYSGQRGGGISSISKDPPTSSNLKERIFCKDKEEKILKIK